MLNKSKAILSLLAFFTMLPSLAFAQGEDIFVGTWQGRLSGEGLEIGPSDDFETGFSMDIVIKVSQASPDERGYVGLPVSGWATVHYNTPKWIPKEDTPIHYSNFKVETVSGKIDGGMWVHYDGRYSEAKSLSLDYSEVRPVITYTVTVEDWPPYTAGGTDHILGVMFDYIPDLELPVVATEDNSIKLHVEDELVAGGIVLYKIKLNGVLYRVDIERDTLGDTIKLNELITTDKHTRKEIIIPNVGEVIVNTESECKFKTDKLLEQMKGELFYKIRKLEPHQFEIRTPVSVIGPRGTQFVTSVEEDGTTTLTVLEGTVEFSDLDKKKTVVVKKNQRSVVKPGGLPAEPVSIDERRIPIWWK